MTLRLLSAAEIRQCITMHEAIDAMEQAFIQLASHQAKLPLRTAITLENENALTLTMPGYLTENEILGLKVVSVFPNNPAKNYPAITGFIMLLDAHTGQPKVLMEAGYLTALRTGAVSGLATRYFARPEAHHVALIGSGAQALTQLEAVAAVRPITRISLWSRTLKNAEALAETLRPRYEVTVHDQVALAVRDADIICTATSSMEPLFHLNAIQPHAHINAIGSHSSAMQEIGQDVLAHATVLVDQVEAVLSESGEIIQAVQQNQLKKDDLIEIGQWLLHKRPPDQQGITVFKSVGLAIQDLSVADRVYRNALQRNLGMTFCMT